jgi:hypothetical protein
MSTLRLAARRSLLLLALVACEEPTRATIDPGATSAPSAPASASAREAPSGAVVVSVTLPSPSATVSASTGPGPQANGPAAPPVIPSTPIEKSFLGKANSGILPLEIADALISKGATSKVLLVSSGADPKAPLRYDFALSSKQTTVMKTSTRMGSGGRTVELPVVEMTLALESAAEKDASGRVRVSGTLTDVSVKAGAGPEQKQIADAMGPGLSPLKGLQVGYSVDSLGKAYDVMLEAPGAKSGPAAKLVDEMRRSFEALVPPVPEEPIGEGAEWQVIQRLDAGVDVLQWTTYSLKKIKGDKVKIVALVQQLATSGKLTLPGASRGVSLLSYDGSGVAETSMALSSFIPEAGVGTVNNAVRFQEGNTPISTETFVKLELSRR